jgi:uncharacterized protein (TIGR03000 family)
MYGVVLMMALSGGADMPAMSTAAGEHVAQYGNHGQKEYRLFGGRGCHGGRGGGCHGGGGCYGGGYGGCYGGGGYGGCHGGGYGGCYGGGGYGCCGGGYGGGYGYGWGGGGYYSSYMPYATGAYGYASDGTPMYYQGTPMYSNGAPMYYSNTPSGYGYGVPINQGDRRYYDDQSRNAEQLGAPQARGEAPATIVVRLPADAKLTIDGSRTRSTEGVRTFTSPPLQPGKEYQYSLTAEVMRDGKKVERTRDVTVRAGQQSEVTFDLPSEGGSSNR